MNKWSNEYRLKTVKDKVASRGKVGRYPLGYANVPESEKALNRKRCAYWSRVRQRAISLLRKKYPSIYAELVLEAKKIDFEINR